MNSDSFETFFGIEMEINVKTRSKFLDKFICDR